MTAEKVLSAARRELGNREAPPGSNRTKYGAWFGLDGYAWCMMFVQWCFAQAGGLELLPVKTASCGALMRAANAAGLWVTGDFQPGDVVIYDFSGKRTVTEHTGIVERASASGVTAIEGNTSETGSQSNGGQVCRKIRPNRLIIGAVRPDFEEDHMPDISKWTDGEILQLSKRLQEVLGKQPLPPALAREAAEAKDLGISDGSSPGAFCTRAQAAVMARRAAEAAGKES